MESFRVSLQRIAVGMAGEAGAAGTQVEILCPSKVILGTSGERTQFTNMMSVGDVGVGATCRGLDTCTGSRKAVSPPDAGVG